MKRDVLVVARWVYGVTGIANAVRLAGVIS